MDESCLYIRYTILEEMKRFSKRFLFDCGLQKNDDFPLSH